MNTSLRVLHRRNLQTPEYDSTSVESLGWIRLSYAFGFCLALVNNPYVVEVFAHISKDLLDVCLAFPLTRLFKAPAQCLKMNESVRAANTLPSMGRSTNRFEVFALTRAIELIELVATVLEERRNQVFQIRIGTNDPSCR